MPHVAYEYLGIVILITKSYAILYWMEFISTNIAAISLFYLISTKLYLFLMRRFVPNKHALGIGSFHYLLIIPNIFIFVCMDRLGLSI